MTDQEESKQPNEIPDEVDNIHPFVALLFAGLVPGEEERYVFPVDLANEVYVGLLDFEGSEELHLIIEQMIQLAIMMHDDFGSPSVASQISMILEDDKVQHIARDVKALADPNIDKLGEKFESFVGKESNKTAPQVGEEKPDGALSLDELDFPKRM